MNLRSFIPFRLSLFSVYQEWATQLVLCHTLTDILSWTPIIIAVDYRLVPIWLFVWWNLYGTSGCNRKQNHQGIEDGWFFLSMLSVLILSVSNLTTVFSSFSTFCYVFIVTFVCEFIMHKQGRLNTLVKVWSKEVDKGKTKMTKWTKTTQIWKSKWINSGVYVVKKWKRTTKWHSCLNVLSHFI